MTKKGIVSDPDTAAEVETPENPVANKVADADNTTTYVYIGPSLPGAKLMTNTVLSGTRKEISDYYKDVIEQYPNVARLIVPVDKLSESRTKARTNGNILHKYYNDLVSQIQERSD